MAGGAAPSSSGKVDRATGPRASRAKIVLFAVLFTILVALGSASELFLLRAKMGEGYQRFIADTVGWALGAIGTPVRVTDTTLTLNGYSVIVAIECTGIKATAIFCAAVLAFPCSWRSKVVGLLAGLLGVGLLNLLRIGFLAMVSGYRHDWFDGIHAVLMQGFLVLFVAPLWIVWMLWANRREAVRAGGVTPCDGLSSESS